MTKQIFVCLFSKLEAEEGAAQYERIQEDFELHELGGVLPDVGDMIVPPQGGRDPTARTVYQVQERWFRPTVQGSPVIGLVVTERHGTREEGRMIVG